MSDPVPVKDSEFDTYFGNIVQYTGQRVTSTPPQWDPLPLASFQELAAAFGAWGATYEPAKIPHAPVQTAEKTGFGTPRRHSSGNS